MKCESMRARIQEYKSQNIRARVVAGLQGKSIYICVCVCVCECTFSYFSEFCMYIYIYQKFTLILEKMNAIRYNHSN